MASYHVEDIRTVALVGHEVAGKTSLADALLFKAKAVERRGSPEDGTSVSDFDEEEKKHKYSIDSSVLHLDFQGKRVHLIRRRCGVRNQFDIGHRQLARISVRHADRGGEHHLRMLEQGLLDHRRIDVLLNEHAVLP